MSTTEATQFDVAFQAHGESREKYRNEISLTWKNAGEKSGSVMLATDECTSIGGHATAAPPMAHFCVAIVGGLMTQIRVFAERMGIEIDTLDVKSYICWSANMFDNEPYEAEPGDINLDIEIGSSASEGDVIRLIEAARKGCFVEQALTKTIQINHRLKRKTGWITL